MGGGGISGLSAQTCVKNLQRREVPTPNERREVPWRFFMGKGCALIPNEKGEKGGVGARRKAHSDVHS